MATKETKAEREAREKAEKIDAAIAAMAETSGFQDSNDFVAQLLDQAEELNTEKEELYERIGANRETLRNILKTGLLSEEQARDALSIYPPVARSENGTEAAAA